MGSVSSNEHDGKTKKSSIGTPGVENDPDVTSGGANSVGAGVNGKCAA